MARLKWRIERGSTELTLWAHQDGSQAENLPRFAPITQGSSDKAEHAANVRKTVRLFLFCCGWSGGRGRGSPLVKPSNCSVELSRPCCWVPTKPVCGEITSASAIGSCAARLTAACRACWAGPGLLCRPRYLDGGRHAVIFSDHIASRRGFGRSAWRG